LGLLESFAAKNPMTPRAAVRVYGFPRTSRSNLTVDPRKW
jgi:hypothetical protein